MTQMMWARTLRMISVQAQQLNQILQMGSLVDWFIENTIINPTETSIIQLVFYMNQDR